MEKPTMNNTITIFVTAYNVAPYLERFFENLSRQTVTDYELLIIDDGSTDDTAQIIKNHAETDNRIRLIEIEHVGISGARNLVFENLRTDLVTSLDADDYFDDNYLKHLLDAQKKYDADLVISNIVYRTPELEETSRFKFRKEALYSESDFDKIVPQLLSENRLNYLYGKLYKAEYLSGLTVEPDVMQGSDTMIVMQYILKIKSIAVIENYDYNYINYKSRSVTSYRGSKYFGRLFRINRFVYELWNEHGRMTPELQRVIDGRILKSGESALKHIARSKDSKKLQYKKASEVINSADYRWSFDRQKLCGNLDSFDFKVIVPGAENEYIDYVRGIVKEEKRGKRVRKLRKFCPDFLFNIYHKTKLKLGLIPPD